MAERILVICEKPNSARIIADSLDDNNNPEHFSYYGVPYHIAHHKNNELIIVSALGHLFSISQKGTKWTYPIYDYEWIPSYLINKSKKKTKVFLDLIRKVSNNVENYVNACDYDIEGSLIGYFILQHIVGKQNRIKANRMKYSTLTNKDLNQAWEQRTNTLDFSLIEAGKVRHEIDWLFGINLTRALTLSLKNSTGLYKILSIGRVQGPTLNFIKEREKKIQAFNPQAYWSIKAKIKLENKQYPLEYKDSQIISKTQAEKIVTDCVKQNGEVTDLKLKNVKLPPLPPFNLGDLQREAYTNFHYSPKKTLQIAEKLYIKTLISYPRTSSQKLPPSLNLNKILKDLNKQKEYTNSATSLTMKSSLKPIKGKKNDPAHPAIYPTGKKPENLTKSEQKVYDLICRRFLACLSKSALKEKNEVKVEINGHLFFLRGSKIIKKGWTLIYSPFLKEKDIIIPFVEINQKIPITKIESVRKLTRPPIRFNPGSLLLHLEKNNIGTQATRSGIIDTLFKRGYIQGNKIAPTSLGFAVLDILQEFVPEVLSVEMTRKMEKDIENIQVSEADGKKVLSEAKRILKPVLMKFKENEELIGNRIYDAMTNK